MSMSMTKLEIGFRHEGKTLIAGTVEHPTWTAGDFDIYNAQELDFLNAAVASAISAKVRQCVKAVRNASGELSLESLRPIPQTIAELVAPAERGTTFFASKKLFLDLARQILAAKNVGVASAEKMIERLGNPEVIPYLTDKARENLTGLLASIEKVSHANGLTEDTRSYAAKVSSALYAEVNEEEEEADIAF